MEYASVYHFITRPSPVSETPRLAQYFPVIPSMSLNPRRIGIFIPSTSNSPSNPQKHVFQYRSFLPVVFVGEPTLLPMSVLIQPGQQAFMSKPGFSRPSTAEKQFMAALLTPYAYLCHPFSISVPLLTHFWQHFSVFLSQRSDDET